LGGLNEAALFEKPISLFGENNIALRSRLISACTRRFEVAEAYLDKRECTGVISSLQLCPPDISIFILDENLQDRFISINPICPRNRIGS